MSEDIDTKIIKVNSEMFEDSEIEEACEILKKNGLVAFPTETVYGLGGDAMHKEASAKIYAAKGRPSDNPLIVHISDRESLKDIAKEVPQKAVKLMDAFWPGPMTLIFKKTDKVPYSTTGGLDTVAVRMPSHPVARELISQSGVYIAAPSANTSGRPSPKNFPETTFLSGWCASSTGQIPPQIFFQAFMCSIPSPHMWQS